MTKLKRRVWICATLFLFMISANLAIAAPLKVLFVGFEGSMAQIDAVRLDILGSDSRFDHSNSASWDGIALGDPALANLASYDSILVWTNAFPNNTQAFGDTLADYVDGGGHLVLATFWGQEGHYFGPSGRINTTGYNPFTSPDPGAYTAATLGVYNSSDPLFQGVLTLSASTYRGDYFAGLDAGATLAGSWSDGKPLAGYNAAQSVVGITLFPNVPAYGHASGDYQQLFRNGLALSAPANSVPEPTTLSLLGLGVAMFGALSRKLKN